MEDIDKFYSPSCWSKRMGSEEIVSNHARIITQSSHTVTDEFSCRLNISYGQGKNQKVNIFGEEETNSDAPLLIYIHGGYWQLFNHQMSAFMAKPIIQNGITFIAVGYDLSPAVSMDEIVQQVINAVNYCLHFAFHRNTRSVWLCGHSAGAHLAAMAAMSPKLANRRLLKGCFLFSGIYDLRPLTKTKENYNLKLTEATAWQLSPINFETNFILECKELQMFVVVAEHDSPAFREQSFKYVDGLLNMGLSPVLIDIENKDHFDVVEDLQLAEYDLTQRIIKAINDEEKS